MKKYYHENEYLAKLTGQICIKEELGNVVEYTFL